MVLTYKDGIFIAISSYSEKDKVKAAGFRWNPEKKIWHTSNLVVARKFEADADSAAKTQFLEFENNIQQSRVADAVAGVEIPVPDGLNYFPYQQAGIAYALGKTSVLIGDEMGLGKTPQSIGIINATNPAKTLIICPATLKLNWRNELMRWLTKPRLIHILQSGQPFPTNVEIVVMNYDIAAKYKPQIHAVEWDLLICDEAHYMKNNRAQRTVAVIGDGKKDKGLKAKRKVFLTGTPITNRPVELWPLASYLFPETFNNFWSFGRRYCDAQMRNGYWDFSGHSNLEELQQILRGVGMIRRLKSQVLKELPPKTRQVVVLPNDTVKHLINREKQQAQMFEERVESLQTRVERSKMSDNPEDYQKAVASLREAYQVAFEEMAAVRKELAVAKIPMVCEHVADAIESNGKVVVMAHHREVIDAITENFGAAAVKLYGGMSEQQKQHSVDSFQKNPDCKVFVGSIRAAGVGITLTASSNVVFAELDWTPANMLQAEDRCHRIGQSENVLVQHLVFDESLDAKMANTLISKMAVIDRALDAAITQKQELEEPEGLTKKKGRGISRAMIDERVSEITALHHITFHLGVKMLSQKTTEIEVDGTGFNKMDAHIGKELAALNNLSDRQAVFAGWLCYKYRRQLPETMQTMAKIFFGESLV